MDDTNGERTIWCGNLSEKVTEEILYELFYQVGPLERVNIPKNRDGSSREYGFVTFCHPCSVEYALKLLKGTRLFDQEVSIKNRVQRNNTSYSNPSSSRTPILSHSDFIRGLAIPNVYPRLSTSEINNSVLRHPSYSSHVHRSMLPSRNNEGRNGHKRKYEENLCLPEPALVETFKTPYAPQTLLNYDNFMRLGRQMLIGTPLIHVNGTIQDSYYGTHISPAGHDQNSRRTSYSSNSDRNSNNSRRRSDHRHHRSYDRYGRRSN